MQCGSRLELRILPGTADPHGPTKLTIQVTRVHFFGTSKAKSHSTKAENVDMEHYEAATASVVFTVVVVPVARFLRKLFRFV